ncbi:unnamed protein product, partial [Amoebophrya sp. A25]|eukprot:GSA25T00012667001.1
MLIQSEVAKACSRKASCIGAGLSTSFSSGDTAQGQGLRHQGSISEAERLGGPLGQGATTASAEMTDSQEPDDLSPPGLLDAGGQTRSATTINSVEGDEIEDMNPVGHGGMEVDQDEGNAARQGGRDGLVPEQQHLQSSIPETQLGASTTDYEALHQDAWLRPPPNSTMLNTLLPLAVLPSSRHSVGSSTVQNQIPGDISTFARQRSPPDDAMISQFLATSALQLALPSPNSLSGRSLAFVARTAALGLQCGHHTLQRVLPRLYGNAVVGS